MDKKKKICFLSCEIKEKDMDFEDLYKKMGNNSGNCLFHWAVPNAILGDRDIDIVEYTEDDQKSILMLALANQINNKEAFVQSSKGLAGLTKQYENCIIFSIGQQMRLDSEEYEINETTLEFLNLISQKTKFICTRGETTTRILKAHGINNVKSLGCPSLLINNNPDLGLRLAGKIQNIKLNKIAFGIHNIDTDMSERVILWCTKYNGTIIQQDDLMLLRHVCNSPNKSMYYLNNMYKNRYHRIFDSREDFYDFINNRIVFFYDIPKWLSYLKTFDLYIGLKIHGTIAGTMAEIPSICIAHDKRVLELSEQCNLPHIRVSSFMELDNLDDIFSRISFDGTKFDRHRQHMANTYMDLLREYNLPINPHLEQIIIG